MKKTDKMSELVAVGERLKEIRKKSGYNNYEHIAYDLDMSRSAYWRLESGENFSLKTLVKVCKVLNITLEEFFTGINLPIIEKKKKNGKKGNTQ